MVPSHCHLKQINLLSFYSIGSNFVFSGQILPSLQCFSSVLHFLIFEFPSGLCTMEQNDFSFSIWSLKIDNSTINFELFTTDSHYFHNLINNPYIPNTSLLQWICCKCLAWWNRHSFFWPQRSWRLSEAKNTPRRPKITWRS